MLQCTPQKYAPPPFGGARPNSLIAAYGQIVPWNIPGRKAGKGGKSTDHSWFQGRNHDVFHGGR